jgi:hypothetical protein
LYIHTLQEKCHVDFIQVMTIAPFKQSNKLQLYFPKPCKLLQNNSKHVYLLINLAIELGQINNNIYGSLSCTCEQFILKLVISKNNNLFYGEHNFSQLTHMFYVVFIQALSNSHMQENAQQTNALNIYKRMLQTQRNTMH